MDLAEFIALMATVVGGFALFAVLFVRLEGGIDRFEQRFDDTNHRLEQRFDTTDQRLERKFDAIDQRYASIPSEFQQLRRELAEEFRNQRAEVSRQVTAISNAILAVRGEH
jgi:DNA anti-recombination protein RmuC